MRCRLCDLLFIMLIGLIIEESAGSALYTAHVRDNCAVLFQRAAFLHLLTFAENSGAMQAL